MSFAEALHKPFDPSRREVLKEAPAGTAAVIFLARDVPADVGKGLTKFLLTTPTKEQRNASANPFAPGAIEANIESPLIQEKFGHLSWLREAVFENTHVLTIAQNLSGKLIENLDNQQELSPGDFLTTSINAAKSVVDPFVLNFEPSAQTLERVHAGLIAQAAPTMPWLTGKELALLGFPVDKYPTSSMFYWGEKGLGTTVFSRVFGREKPEVDEPLTMAGKEPQYNGKDRMVHFSQYALLAFEYLYAKHYNLPEQQAIPLGLKTVLDVLEKVGVDNATQTAFLAQAVGIGYELQVSLANDNNRPSPFGKNRGNVSEGLFDPMVAADIKANILGMLTGIALFKRAVAGKEIEQVLTELDDPKWQQFETLPYLQSADPKYIAGKEVDPPKSVQFINFLLNKYAGVRS